MMQIEKIMRYRRRNDRGFTLIEIIAVLVIIAIISAVVISRGMATDEVKLQAEVDTLKGHLRYAQYLALNDIPPVKWGIQVGGTSYTLIKVDAVGTTSPFSLPGGSSATHSFENGVTATGTGTVLFNEWGSPDTPIPAIALGGQSITVTTNTGFIQ
jgi:prepilin-type N-terminal cleavage/methylation domain-containing protein